VLLAPVAILALVVGAAVMGGHRVSPASAAASSNATEAPHELAVGIRPAASLAPSDAIAPFLNGPAIVAGVREEGTDALIGRLPFGLVGDTPTVYGEREDRFAKEPLYTPSSLAELQAPERHKLGPIRVGPYPR
jgi:hypothetical protein